MKTRLTARRGANATYDLHPKKRKMEKDWLYTLLFSLVNGVFTMVIAAAVFTMYMKTSRRFYLIWSVDFPTYGRAVDKIVKLDPIFG